MGEMILEKLRLRAIECDGLGDEHLDALFQQTVDCPYYRFVYFLVRELRPSRTVELGAEIGRCTAHMAAANPEGEVVAIDPEKHGLFEGSVAPYDNVKFVQTRSDDLDTLAQIEDHSVGLCFIDSIHSGIYTSKEVGLWAPKMEGGGLFLLDDLELNDSMRTVLSRLPFEEKGLLDGLHAHAGFGYAIV